MSKKSISVQIWGFTRPPMLQLLFTFMVNLRRIENDEECSEYCAICLSGPYIFQTILFPVVTDIVTCSSSLWCHALPDIDFQHWGVSHGQVRQKHRPKTTENSFKRHNPHKQNIFGENSIGQQTILRESGEKRQEIGTVFNICGEKQATRVTGFAKTAFLKIWVVFRWIDASRWSIKTCVTSCFFSSLTLMNAKMLTDRNYLTLN